LIQKAVSETCLELKLMIKRVLKFFLVDFPVNILGDLFEQPLPVWLFIGWGWLSILIMVTSVYASIAIYLN